MFRRFTGRPRIGGARTTTTRSTSRYGRIGGGRFKPFGSSLGRSTSTSRYSSLTSKPQSSMSRRIMSYEQGLVKNHPGASVNRVRNGKPKYNAFLDETPNPKNRPIFKNLHKSVKPNKYLLQVGHQVGKSKIKAGKGSQRTTTKEPNVLKRPKAVEIKKPSPAPKPKPKGLSKEETKKLFEFSEKPVTKKALDVKLPPAKKAKPNVKETKKTESTLMDKKIRDKMPADVKAIQDKIDALAKANIQGEKSDLKQVKAISDNLQSAKKDLNTNTNNRKRRGAELKEIRKEFNRLDNRFPKSSKPSTSKTAETSFTEPKPTTSNSLAQTESSYRGKSRAAGKGKGPAVVQGKPKMKTFEIEEPPAKKVKPKVKFKLKASTLKKLKKAGVAVGVAGAGAGGAAGGILETKRKRKIKASIKKNEKYFPPKPPVVKPPAPPKIPTPVPPSPPSKPPKPKPVPKPKPDPKPKPNPTGGKQVPAKKRKPPVRVRGSYGWWFKKK